MAGQGPQVNKVKPNIVAGFKRKANLSNVDLSSLSPFVNLTAIIDKEEYDAVSAIQNNQGKIPAGFFDAIHNRSYIINILGADKQTIANINRDLFNESYQPLRGIELSKLETQSKANNWTGGLGIKGLQTDRSTALPMSETFKIDLTITEPRLIKERYEYNKLITVGSYFLIMYGWNSNVLKFDEQRRQLDVDLSSENINNNGYWRYAFVQLHKFDWSFDDVGHMDGSLSFIASQNADFIFNRSKSTKIGHSVKYFMNSRFISEDLSIDRYLANADVINTETDDTGNEESIAQNYLDGLVAADEANFVGGGDLEDKKYARFITTKLAINGYFGNVRLFLDLDDDDHRWNGGDKSKPRLQLNTSTGELISSIWNNSRPELPESYLFYGDYITGLGFVKNPALNPALAVNKYIGSKGNIFFPIKVGEDNSIVEFNENFFDVSGPQEGNKGFAEFATTIQLAQPKYDSKFLGKQIVESKTGEIEEQYWMKDLPEGIIITKFNNKAYKSTRPFLNADGQIETERIQRNLVDSEELQFYYLGWLIEAIKYYNKKFGGAGFDVKHSELGTGVANKFLPSFVEIFNESVSDSLKEANDLRVQGRIDKNDNRMKTIIDPEESLAAGGFVARKVKPSDIRDKSFYEAQIGTPGFVGPVTDNRAWNAGRKGLYLSEQNDGKMGDTVFFKGHGIAMPNPGNDDIWSGNKLVISTMPDTSDKGRFPLNTIRRKSDKSDVVIDLDSEIWIERLGGDNEVVDKIDIFGGSAASKLEWTWQLPMYADLVNEILENSDLNLVDMVNEILTKTCALKDIGLSTRQEDGVTKIISVNTINTESQQLSLDWTLNGVNDESDPNFVLDYRSKNSLIKGISISSKLDPNIGFLYNASLRSIGNQKKVLRFINDNKRTSSGSSGQGDPTSDKSFSSFLTDYISSGRGNFADNDDVDREKFTEIITSKKAIIDGFTTESADLPPDVEDIINKIPEDAFTHYLSQDYKLYKQMNIMLMAESDYVNNMFTYYMNQVQAEIHGTVGLNPYEYVQLRNVSDLIDGFYAIIGISDKVSGGDFTTDLQLMLVLPGSQVDNNVVPIGQNSSVPLTVVPPVTRYFSASDVDADEAAFLTNQGSLGGEVGDG